MSTSQTPDRSTDARHAHDGASHGATAHNGTAHNAAAQNGDAYDGGPALSVIDAADLEEAAAYRLVSVDDLDYLYDALRDVADLLGVTAKGLRQLGVSPEEAAGTCAAIERHLHDVGTIAFAVGADFRSPPTAES